MLDNVGGMILMASLLVGVFGMDRNFVLTRMIPGTAVGVLVGDLIFTALAFRLARRTGRADVTAMPLGLDTPSTFGSVLFIIGPAYKSALASSNDPAASAHHAWMLGLTLLLASGVFKIACAPFCGWIRKVVPRAGLLGSLTAIALVLISFLPLLDIVSEPVVGMVSLGLMLATLTARWQLPRQFPGALFAVGVGCVLYYGLYWLGFGPESSIENARPSLAFRPALPLPFAETLAWLGSSWREAVAYLPIAIPLALATVVGGIDCTESAAAAGDEYRTGQIVAVEGLATLIAGIFGGVIQTTPYIGQPAYKAMGARSAYTLATALFIGTVGILGVFDWIFYLVPKAVIFPVLIFIGLEITSQSFHATPFRHYPAVGFACVPALAYLAKITLDPILPLIGMRFAELPPATQHSIQTVTMLSGGFILTSLLWASALSNLIDGKIRPVVITLLIAALFSWFGIIHSPLPSSPLLPPGEVLRLLEESGRGRASALQTPYHWTAAYVVMALALLALSRFGQPPPGTKSDRETSG
jgi:AGZA family xanthine/uracil permease-like MFS transporter